MGKSNKIINKIVEYSLIAPFFLAVALISGSMASIPLTGLYQAYSSGFARAYNERIESCLNRGGDIKTCKQELLTDVVDLHAKGHNLEQIIEQLKNY